MSNLTKTTEAIPEVVDMAPSPLDLSSIANPYEDPELAKVLGRRYKISEFVWDDADQPNGALLTIDIFEALLSIPNVADKLTQFRWMHSDMEIEVKLNTTPFHVGSVFVAHIPRTANQDSVVGSMFNLKTQTLAQISQLNAMVLTASSLNNAKFVVQRQAPILFDPVVNGENSAGCMGVLLVRVLNPLLLSSGETPAPVTATVFARFVNPHPVGYGYFPLSPEETVGFKPQSLQSEANVKANNSIVAPEASSIGPATVITGAVDSIAGALANFAGGASQFATLLGLSKPPNQTTPDFAIIDDFRDLNYAHGVSNAVKLAVHPSSSLGDPRVSYLKKHKFSEIISRPSLIQSYLITPETALSVPFALLPVHPSLCYYTETGGPGTGVYTPTHLGYVSQAFRYWRGSIKLRFQFITSQFVSARIRIAHWPGPSIPSDIEDYAGDVVSEIVDVRGETIRDITIPYINPVPYSRCEHYINTSPGSYQDFNEPDELTSFVSVSLVNKVQPATTATDIGIYMNVFMAAGEDFTFLGYINPEPRVLPGVTIVPQSLVQDFSKPFPSLVPHVTGGERGVVSPETFSTVENYLMKPSVTEVPVNGSMTGIPIQVRDYTYPDGFTSPSPYTDALEYFRRIFRWHRGGIRFKCFMLYTGTPTSTVASLGLFAQEKQTDLSPTPMFSAPSDIRFRSVVEAEVPWLYPTAMASNWYGPCPADDFVSNPPYSLISVPPQGLTTYDLIILRAVADDFCFGELLPVPFVNAPAPPPAKKIISSAPTPSSSPTEKVSSSVPTLDQSVGQPLTKAEILKRLGILKS